MTVRRSKTSRRTRRTKADGVAWLTPYSLTLFNSVFILSLLGLIPGSALWFVVEQRSL